MSTGLQLLCGHQLDELVPSHQPSVSLYKGGLVGCHRIAGPVCNALASKVLKQRPGTVQRAKDVYLMFCELEQAESVVVSLVSLAHLVIPVCQKLSELPVLAGVRCQSLC